MPHPENIQELTDRELLERFYKDHDNEWLGVLLPRYTYLLLGVCMKYLKNGEDARDAVQQIFLKVIHELQKYEVGYFKSWIYMIARNHCLMKLRDDRQVNVEIHENLLHTGEPFLQENHEEEKNRKLEYLELAMQELNEEQRKSLTLFYLEKKSYSEIAELTGYTLLQVKSHLQNGRRKLKILMEEKLKEINPLEK